MTRRGEERKGVAIDGLPSYLSSSMVGLDDSRGGVQGWREGGKERREFGTSTVVVQLFRFFVGDC